MSDADRALVGRDRRRSTALGIPIVSGEIGEFESEDFTPITDVLALVESERERQITIALWRHIRNVEMRSRARVGSGVDITEHIAEDAETHRQITESLADIHGKAGTNGKLGELKRRVDALSSRAWLLLTAFVGALGTALIKVVMVTRAFDAVEHKANAAESQIKILQAQVMTLTSALIARYPSPPGNQ